jgi:hypothetical protein
MVREKKVKTNHECAYHTQVYKNKKINLISFDITQARTNSIDKNWLFVFKLMLGLFIKFLSIFPFSYVHLTS